MKLIEDIPFSLRQEEHLFILRNELGGVEGMVDAQIPSAFDMEIQVGSSFGRAKRIKIQDGKHAGEVVAICDFLPEMASDGRTILVEAYGTTENPARRGSKQIFSQEGPTPVHDKPGLTAEHSYP